MCVCVCMFLKESKELENQRYENMVLSLKIPMDRLSTKLVVCLISKRFLVLVEIVHLEFNKNC